MKQRLATITIIFFLPICSTFGQVKGDYIWMFGMDSSSPNPLFNGCTVDFNFSPPDLFPEDREVTFDVTNTSMCDDDGNLLFYSNGRKVFYPNHNVMFNGDELNLDFTVGPSQEIRLNQGILSLPDPINPLQYYLIHFGEDIISNPNTLDIVSHPLFYSKVVLDNGGFPNGIMMDKNTILSQDTFDNGKITATRHANGRDWWMILAKYDSNQFYRFLISPNGIENLGI